METRYYHLIKFLLYNSLGIDSFKYESSQPQNVFLTENQTEQPNAAKTQNRVALQPFTDLTNQILNHKTSTTVDMKSNFNDINQFNNNYPVNRPPCNFTFQNYDHQNTNMDMSNPYFNNYNQEFLNNFMNHYSQNCYNDQYFNVQVPVCPQRKSPETYKDCSTIVYHRKDSKNLSADRNYRCQYKDCGKAYTKRSHLKAHEKIHTGEKPFKCTYISPEGKSCSEIFTRSDQLTRHTRRHNNDRRFACEFCCRRFFRSDHCKNHETRCKSKNSSGEITA